MFSSDQQIFRGLSIHLNNQCHPQSGPPSSSATLKQHHPSSATLKQHHPQATRVLVLATNSLIHPFDFATMQRQTWWPQKTTNKTPMWRWTRTQKQRTRHPGKHELDHTNTNATTTWKWSIKLRPIREIQYDNTRSSSQPWRLHHHKGKGANAT